MWRQLPLCMLLEGRPHRAGMGHQVYSENFSPSEGDTCLNGARTRSARIPVISDSTPRAVTTSAMALRPVMMPLATFRTSPAHHRQTLLRVHCCECNLLEDLLWPVSSDALAVEGFLKHCSSSPGPAQQAIRQSYIHQKF